MLHTEQEAIRTRCTQGRIGLELESQRTDWSGRLACTDHPFPGHRHIVRDFGEAQLEINTPTADSPSAALGELHALLGSVHQTLEAHREVLWPFSNPPVIRSEADIRIAVFENRAGSKYRYRRYLAQKYGKYLMTYSGIHFNYSFPESLLEENARPEGVETREDYRAWRDRFYLDLAEQVLRHSWVVVALLGASPLADSSFFEAGRSGETVFSGSASLRSGPLGYWNHFVPLLCYDSMDAYADSIQRYIEAGLIAQESELYYPVRLKSPGAYSLQSLRERGADHIELRMIDLNPFAVDGIALEDLQFLQLFLVWLAAQPRRRLDEAGQVAALQNHKRSAAYDWSMIRITDPAGRSVPLALALEAVLGEMEQFFQADSGDIHSALRCQWEKLREPSKRYASRVRAQFGGDYIRSGLSRAAEIQERFHV